MGILFGCFACFALGASFAFYLAGLKEESMADDFVNGKLNERWQYLLNDARARKYRKELEEGK